MAFDKLKRDFMGGVEPVKFIMAVDLAKPDFKDDSIYVVLLRIADGVCIIMDQGIIDAKTKQGIEDQIQAIASQYEGITILKECYFLNKVIKVDAVQLIQ